MEEFGVPRKSRHEPGPLTKGEGAKERKWGKNAVPKLIKDTTKRLLGSHWEEVVITATLHP